MPNGKKSNGKKGKKGSFFRYLTTASKESKAKPLTNKQAAQVST
jgi:hypothetical protein